MTIVKWEGIPAQFWPDTDYPWRVSWGLGAFVDFAAREEAQVFYEKSSDEGRQFANPPFNTINGK